MNFELRYPSTVYALPEKVGVAIPTYNEKANLRNIIDRLLKVFKNNKLNCRIVIVDDNSSDGTGKLADALAQKHLNITVIHRPGKLGLGSAYKDAFNFLLNDPEIAVVMEMDADLSHKPEYIPSLLAKINEGYDVAIGSRYIAGGGIDEEWTAMRRLISKSANFLAVMFAGLNVKDATGGFRAYDSCALRTIDLSKVRTNGYAFQIDMLSQCKKVGCEVVEVPITFYERKHGKSKLARSSMLEFIKTLENAFFNRVFSLVAVSFQSLLISLGNVLWIGIKPLQIAIKQANEQNRSFTKHDRAFSR
ncbi:MAG: polyprenol monophosphomannose synthase [Candidatus Bathyarchaeia archaeon]